MTLTWAGMEVTISPSVLIGIRRGIAMSNAKHLAVRTSSQAPWVPVRNAHAMRSDFHKLRISKLYRSSLPSSMAVVSSIIAAAVKSAVADGDLVCPDLGAAAFLSDAGIEAVGAGQDPQCGDRVAHSPGVPLNCRVELLALGISPDRLTPVPPACLAVIKRGTWARLRGYGISI